MRLIWDWFGTGLIRFWFLSGKDLKVVAQTSHESPRYLMSRGKIEHSYESVWSFFCRGSSLMIHKTIIGDVSECSSLRDISATSDTTYTSIISTEEKNTIIIFNWECKLMFSFKTTELLMALDIKYAHSISFFAYISVLLCETRNVFVSDSNNSYANWIQNTKRVVHSGNWFRPESETFVRCHCAMSAITWNR